MKYFLSLLSSAILASYNGACCQQTGKYIDSISVSKGKQGVAAASHTEAIQIANPAWRKEVLAKVTRQIREQVNFNKLSSELGEAAASCQLVLKAQGYSEFEVEDVKMIRKSSSRQLDEKLLYMLKNAGIFTDLVPLWSLTFIVKFPNLDVEFTSNSGGVQHLPLMSAPLNVLITTDKMRDYYKSIQERIYGNLTEYPASKNTGAIALFSITPEGKIRDCILGRSSGSNSRDFACLEAIYGSSPLSPPTQERVQNSCNTKYRPGMQRAQIDFYETKYPKQFALPTEFKDSVVRHVQGKDKDNEVVFLHLLPLDVMNRYPGLFSIDELSSSENVKELSTKGLIGPSVESPIHKVFANTSIKQFFSNWEDFFCSHVKATREQLLEFRAQQKLLLEQ